MDLNLTEAESINLESLDRRLAIVRTRVVSVAKGYQNGFYLWGEGGIGKSYSVIRELDRLHTNYKVTNSRLTGKGLFELLEEYPDHVHVLEDMESLCQDKNAAGVLRSALWTTDPDKMRLRQDRHVTWIVAKEKRRVIFTGGIILTMNAPLDDMPALRAVKTRIPHLKLEPTNAEVAALMKSIALMGFTQGGRTISPEECLEVFEFVKATCDKHGRNYDLRMLVNGCSDRLQCSRGHSETDWKDLLNSRLRERVIRSPEPVTRAVQMSSDREIALEIAAMDLPISDKLVVWKDRTGKGRQAYYDRLKESNPFINPDKPERPDYCLKGDQDHRTMLAKQ